jgi:hypothetical protein
MLISNLEENVYKMSHFEENYSEIFLQTRLKNKLRLANVGRTVDQKVCIV